MTNPRQETNNKQRNQNGGHKKQVKKIALEDLMVRPGNNMPQQLSNLLEALITHASESAHLKKINVTIENDKEEEEKDFYPEKVDKTRYTKTVKRTLTDDKGNAILDDNGKRIIVDFTYVDDEELKQELKEEYDRKAKKAHEQFEDYKDAKQATLFLLKSRFDKLLWNEIENNDHPETKENFKKLFGKGELVKCLKIIKMVCGTSADGSLKFPPMHAVERLHTFTGSLQLRRSLIDYTKFIEGQCETLRNLDGPHFAGTGFTKHFLHKAGKTWEDYKKMSEDEQKAYDDKGLDLLNACVFTRGCKTKDGAGKLMAKTLAELYAHGDKDVYPLSLGKAVKLYRVSYMPKPHELKKRNDNDDDNDNDALGAHFDDTERRVAEMLALHDSEFEITDNDDISFVSIKSEEEMIC